MASVDPFSGVGAIFYLSPMPAIITKDHQDFPQFVCLLGEQLKECRHDHAATIEVLNVMGADILGTLAYLRSQGGYCDCEVMFNVVPWEAGP